MKHSLLFNCFFRCVVHVFSFTLTLLAGFTLSAQTFPSGFSQVWVAGITYPTSMAFAPDGRIFCTEKAGKVKIVKNGVELSTPFLSVNVDQLNERGLSSICLDPNFNSNHYVYIYYTTASSPIRNRLSRFTANGDVAVPGSEVVILNFEPLVGSIHNAGAMVFGADGKLYLSVGDDNVSSNAQDLNSYKGKILRINSDGSVPSGNPFTGSEPAKRIWAYGLRNPWTIAIQPGTNKIFVNDVGAGTWEEINDATAGGRNFGWPGAEGMSSNPAYTNPVYTYHHGSGTDQGCAITGGTFFNPSSTNYPSQYIGKYFFIDYCNKWINYLNLSGGVTKSDFASSVGSSNNYLKVGPDGNLYYFSISQNALYKIVYSGSSAPVITSQPSSKTVSQGQSVAFNVSASGTNPLSYQWKKNGTNIPGANLSSFTISSVQTSDAGQYNVAVSNSFGSTSSNPATLTVTSFNAKPAATILTPASGTFYRSGDIISFSGNATDAEDGTLPASAFQWIVTFHHDQHNHPGPFVPSGVKSGSFNSNFGETSANVFWRISLVVTDSKGLKDTAVVEVRPVTSTLGLASVPSGLQIMLEGQPKTTPHSVLAVSGMTRAMDASLPQVLNGYNYVFDYWQHGGNVSQNITITDVSKTYTAVFKNTGVATCSAAGTITRDYWANVSGYSVSSIPVNTTPTNSGQLTIFESPSNSGDNYGERVRGYICPSLTGNYIFWIASDDNSELWLSTDDQPGNKLKIASVSGYTSQRQWTKYPSQQSAPINLVSGKKYYIEALHKEGSQGDNLAVGWQLPNSVQERPVPGSRLSPYIVPGNNTPIVSITSPANNTAFSSSANINISVSATSPNSVISKVEYYQGSIKIGESNVSPFSFLWSNVPTGNYALKAVATDKNGLSGTSATVNVIVNTCATPIVTALGPLKFCSGSVTLSVNHVAGNIYQWKKDGVNITGATGSSYTASQTGDYQVKVIQGSCITWSAPAPVRVQSGLSASITPGGPTSFCSGGKVTLYANTCSGYTYKWKKDGQYISGATGTTYVATTSGSYQLQITLGTSNAWSSLVAITVNNCTFSEQEDLPTETAIGGVGSSGDMEMKVYPNPNSGLFTIGINMAAIQQETIEMKIVNMLGETVFEKKLSGYGSYINEVVELDRSLLPGIYILKIIAGNQVESTSMVLTK